MNFTFIFLHKISYFIYEHTGSGYNTVDSLIYINTKNGEMFKIEEHDFKNKSLYLYYLKFIKCYENNKIDIFYTNRSQTSEIIKTNVLLNDENYLSAMRLFYFNSCNSKYFEKIVRYYFGYYLIIIKYNYF